MAHRIEIYTKKSDTRSQVMKKKLESLGFQIEKSTVVDTYTINKDFDKETLDRIAQILSNPITQTYLIDKPNKEIDFDFALEIGFLPGVTDNEGHTAKETIEDLLKEKLTDEQSVHTTRLIFLKGNFTKEEIQKAGEAIANKLIQRIHIKSKTQFDQENAFLTRSLLKRDLHFAGSSEMQKSRKTSPILLSSFTMTQKRQQSSRLMHR